MTHKIVVVYQSLLGIYGDRGNAQVLVKRLQWRGEDAELVDVEPGQPVPPDGLVYLLGGGEDQAQIAAVEALQSDGGLAAGLAAGAVLFAVCAGYQLCGHSFTVGDSDIVHAGLGLLDVETRRGTERAIGEILTSWTRPDGRVEALTGFENHGGYTTLGQQARPFAKVEIGVGNGTDGYDGAVQGKVIGCYPHGPILPRNPALADHLLELALGRELGPLPRPDVNARHETLRAERLRVVRTTRNRAEQTR
jgi:CobQ-like glutamine amidotransferase family enzyme